jgi:hypothetical protein
MSAGARVRAAGSYGTRHPTEVSVTWLWACRSERTWVRVTAPWGAERGW